MNIKMNDLITALNAAGAPFSAEGRLHNFSLRTDEQGRIILDTIDCVCGAWVIGTFARDAAHAAQQTIGHMRWCCS